MRYEKIEMSVFDGMVADHQASLTDVTVPVKDIAYKTGGEITVSENTALGLMQITGKANKNAYEQLAYRLGAPGAWLRSDKCPADLEEYIVNRLKQDKDTPALFRYRQSKDEQIIRAVLSDSYLIYNHADVVKAVNKALEGTSLETLSPKVWKPFLSDVMDYWIFLDGVVADPDKAPELYDRGGAGGLHPAIHIRNGEDGTAKVVVESGMMRDYCANGVIFGWSSQSTVEQIHRGTNRQFISTAIALAVGEAARLSGLGIKKFLDSTLVEIHSGIDEMVDGWAKDFKVSANLDDWKKAVSRSRTLADLSMATSDYAGSLQDRDEQVSLERVAGDMILNGRRRVNG